MITTAAITTVSTQVKKHNDTCAAWLLRMTMSAGHAQTGDTDDEVISESRGDCCRVNER